MSVVINVTVKPTSRSVPIERFVGIPNGGNTSQVLAKKTDQPFDVEWADPAEGGGGGGGGIPSGGTTGQVLAKVSNTSYATQWVDPQSGPKGDTGDQGIPGVKGDTGDQGIPGVKGDTGDQGIPGVKGDTGDQGIPGVKGDTGDQGIPGVKGDTGDQGIPGVKGDAGDQGVPGVKGDTGDQGIPGVKGDTGDQGIPGVKGDTGDQGPPGSGGDLNNVTYQWDFLTTGTTADIWTGVALSSGNTSASATAVIDVNHPGAINVRSSATANSGYRFTSGTGSTGTLLLKAETSFTGIFYIPTTADPREMRIGFLQSTNQTASPNAAQFVLSGLDVSASCVSSTAVTSVTMATLTADAWYTFEVLVNSSSSVTFSIYNAIGGLVATTTITTNVPVLSVGCGFIAWSTGTVVSTLCYADYIELKFKNLTRR